MGRQPLVSSEHDTNEFMHPSLRLRRSLSSTVLLAWCSKLKFLWCGDTSFSCSPSEYHHFRHRSSSGVFQSGLSAVTGASATVTNGHFSPSKSYHPQIGSRELYRCWLLRKRHFVGPYAQDRWTCHRPHAHEARLCPEKTRTHAPTHRATEG